MKYILPHIKAVLLDHDDTLVGTIESKWKQHKYVAKTHYGKDLHDDEIRQHWGKPLGELVGILYGTDNIEQAMAYNTACHENYPKVLFKESISVLRELKSQGLLLGIVTATTRFSFEHDMSLHGFPPEVVDYTQTAEDTPFHKPDSRVFDPAVSWLEGHGIQAEQVLYVGDGLHDMKAALGAGFEFVGVETGLISANEFRLAGTVSIPTVSQLVEV